MKRRTWILIGIIVSCFPLAAVSGASAIDNGECLECHGDESLTRQGSEGANSSLYVDQKTFQYSVHNLNGIGCVDCHADIATLDSAQDVPHSLTLAPVNCGSCHEAEAVEYRKGVHQQASSKGMTIQCYACHGYHDVVSGEHRPVIERENRSCLKCHEPKRHHNWLPQKETHFSYVQCTVCHAPDAPHHIHLRFYDLAKRDFLRPEALFSALGTDSQGFLTMFNRDERVDELNAEEFENMVFVLSRRGLHVTFHAELLSEREPSVHQVSRVSAQRSCEDCHAPDSRFFDSVAVSFVDQEGVGHQIKVDRKVLESYSVSNFYLPGGSRVRKLDQIGILAVLGAGAGISLHLLGRAVTAPWRRRRRAESEARQDGGRDDR